MPLFTHTASPLANPTVLSKLVIGERISHASKDVLLPAAGIRLPWLADRFIESLPYRFAFIAAGAFWMLFHVEEPHRF